METKWIEVRELDEETGKVLPRVYKIEGIVAIHRGRATTLNKLVSRCIDMVIRNGPFEAAFKDYVLCFKGINDPRQRRFEIKRSSPFNKMRSIGLDLDTGEVCKLGDFIVENAYTENDVVSIITRGENLRIRNIQRARA